MRRQRIPRAPAGLATRAEPRFARRPRRSLARDAGYAAGVMLCLDGTDAGDQ